MVVVGSKFAPSVTCQPKQVAPHQTSLSPRRPQSRFEGEASSRKKPPFAVIVRPAGEANTRGGNKKNMAITGTRGVVLYGYKTATWHRYICVHTSATSFRRHTPPRSDPCALCLSISFSVTIRALSLAAASVCLGVRVQVSL